MSLGSAIAVPVENLYRDPYITIDIEDGGRLVRLIRSAQPFPHVDVLEQSYRAVGLIYDGLGRRGRSMLADVRQAMGRNDPEFEMAMRRILPVIDRGFDRVAVLVQTAIGSLQARRWSYEDDFARLVSGDEQELLRYLRTGEVPMTKT